MKMGFHLEMLIDTKRHPPHQPLVTPGNPLYTFETPLTVCNPF